jgi:cytochrome oxidase assembly protein ShyY1
VVFKVLGKTVVVLILAAAFLFLGLWQLDRANELQESKKVIPDSTIYQLADLATPATSLDSRNVGKKVQLRGNSAHPIKPIVQISDLIGKLR